MSADFSQFEDGDTIRVTYEGKWHGSHMSLRGEGPERRHYRDGSLRHAKSAELVEREVKPYHEGDVVLCGKYVRRRDADGIWRDGHGNYHAQDGTARDFIRKGSYEPVILHGQLVDQVKSRG